MFLLCSEQYGEFVDANEDALKMLAPPQCAVEYYRGDLYMLDDFQADASVAGRDPPCDNLYDVFANIRCVCVCVCYVLRCICMLE